MIVDNGSNEREISKLKLWLVNKFSLVVCYDTAKAVKGGEFEQESLLKAAIPNQKVVLVQNKKNLGFAAGNNVAIKYVKKVRGKYFFILNNDTIIKRNTLSLLVDFYEHNEGYAAVIPQIRYMSKPDFVWNCGGQIKWYGNRKYFYQGKHFSNINEESFDVSFATGCAILFQARTFEGFSEKFFFGEEDYELALRLRKQKEKMICYTKPLVYHRVGSSKEIIGKKKIGEVFIFYLQRLMDNKDYHSRYSYIFKKIIFMSYIFFSLLTKRNLSTRQIVNFYRELLYNLKNLDKVDDKTFFKYLREDFK